MTMVTDEKAASIGPYRYLYVAWILDEYRSGNTSGARIAARSHAGSGGDLHAGCLYRREYHCFQSGEFDSVAAASISRVCCKMPA